MATRKKQNSEIAKMSQAMPDAVAAFELELGKLSSAMDALKKEGLIYASEHWRKDSEGQGKYMYLLYPQVKGEKRRREYVGANQDSIEQARAGIARAGQFDRLQQEYSVMQYSARQAADAMRDALRALKIS